MKIIITLLIALCHLGAAVQIQDPVRWSFSTKYLGGDIYEVHFSATIEEPWHIYSQDMNEDIAFPTAFIFNQNPLIQIVEPTKSITPVTEKVISGIRLRYFRDQAEFIQTVKVKGNAKVIISGKIDYMACTNSHCLPPTQRRFSLSLKQ